MALGEQEFLRRFLQHVVPRRFVRIRHYGLLASLEALSDEENERAWVDEADRRDVEWGSAPGSSRSASDVLRDARAKLK
jgi:hypothetical protein